MDLRVASPSAEGLSVLPEDDSAQAPQEYERAVRHDGRNVSRFDDPRRNEFGEAVTPDVLVDGNGNKEGASNWLVGVNSVGGHNRWDRGDLDAGCGKRDDDDRLPRPLPLVADCCDNVADVHDDDVRNHGHQSHLGLANATIPLGCSSCYPIAELTRGTKADKGTNEDCEIEETNRLGAKVVWRSGKHLGLGEIESQERRTRPADDECGEFDNRKCEELPWQDLFDLLASCHW